MSDSPRKEPLVLLLGRDDEVIEARCRKRGSKWTAEESLARRRRILATCIVEMERTIASRGDTDGGKGQ